MAFSVGELSRLTGITIRTLHYYDEIGLIRPSRRSEGGYRQYDDQDVLRLQRVLLYRELGLPLEQIAHLLDQPESHQHILQQQRETLLQERARLDQMICALEQAIHHHQEGKPMHADDVKRLFEGFDPASYEQEAEERWGNTDAYRESMRRTKSYRKEDWDRIKSESAAIYQRIADRMKAGAPPTDKAVQASVEDHRRHIDRYFYPCSKQMHQGLGQMYVADERFTANLDKVASGFAAFFSEAIAAASAEQVNE